MALFALGAHLPAMDISVAVSAGVADVGKNHLGVALGAGGQRRVHAAQGVAGFVVIKIRHRANWLPAGAGMARLAGEAEIAVRASGSGPVLLLGCNDQRCKYYQQQCSSTFHW